MPRLKDLREVINADWPEVKVTRRTVQRAVEYQGQVRKPYSPAEYEAKRARVLNTPLP